MVVCLHTLQQSDCQNFLLFLCLFSELALLLVRLSRLDIRRFWCCRFLLHSQDNILVIDFFNNTNNFDHGHVVHVINLKKVNQEALRLVNPFQQFLTLLLFFLMTLSGLLVLSHDLGQV